MAYAKTEPGILNHRKFIGLNPAAIGLWTMGNAYCMDQLSDGLIPYEQIPKLVHAQRQITYRLAAALVERVLWERSGRDYLVHDFLVYNPSKAQIQAGRSAAKQRKEKWKERRSEQRSEQRSEHDPGTHMERERNTASSSSSSTSSNLKEALATRNGVPDHDHHSHLDRYDLLARFATMYPDAVRRDCPERKFRNKGNCVDPAWLAEHPEVTIYPTRDAQGAPMQCLHHRAVLPFQGRKNAAAGGAA